MGEFFKDLLNIASSPYAIVVYIDVVLVQMVAVENANMSRDGSAGRVRAAAKKEDGKGEQKGSAEMSAPAAPQEEGDFSVGEEKKETPSAEGVSRFGRLSRVDAERASYVRNCYDDNVTLKGICEGLRNFAAGNLRLYYSIDDIRRFIAGLLVSPIMILQGMSGTGKTSLACAFGKYVDNTSMVVPVQPMWKERSGCTRQITARIFSSRYWTK